MIVDFIRVDNNEHITSSMVFNMEHIDGIEMDLDHRVLYFIDGRCDRPYKMYLPYAVLESMYLFLKDIIVNYKQTHKGTIVICASPDFVTWKVIDEFGDIQRADEFPHGSGDIEGRR